MRPLHLIDTTERTSSALNSAQGEWSRSLKHPTLVEVAANDPFFVVYQYLQHAVAEMKKFPGALPCPGDVVGGHCLHAASFAIEAFQSILGLPTQNAFEVYFPDVQRHLGVGRCRPHMAVYVKDGGRAIGAQGDIFFDPTSAQFAKPRGLLPLYRNLMVLDPERGASMARELFLRGYILLSEEQDIPRALGTVVSAYVSAAPCEARKISPDELEALADRKSKEVYADFIKGYQARYGSEISLENLSQVDRRIQFSGSPFGKASALV